MNVEKTMFQLPFADAPIQSSSKVSFAYSILKTNLGESFDKLLLYKFISCYYDEDMCSEEFSFSRDDLWGTRKKITIVQDVDLLKEAYNGLQFDVVRFVSFCLKSGIYVQGKFNRSLFDKTFEDCEMATDYYLITGWNPLKKVFLIRYFDIDRQCKYLEFDYETFYNSVFNIPAERIRFCLIKFCDYKDCETDIDIVVSAFELYIQSSESKLTKTHKRVYGLEAMNKLEKYIQERIDTKNQINQIYILCLAEQKDLMLRRVTYLIENDFLPPQLLKKAKIVSSMTNQLLELVHEYNFGVVKNTEIKIIELIRRINSVERDYLSILVKMLKSQNTITIQQ